jgi:hypothetical protein
MLVNQDGSKSAEKRAEELVYRDDTLRRMVSDYFKTAQERVDFNNRLYHRIANEIRDAEITARGMHRR